jgi:hypothetical protein
MSASAGTAGLTPSTAPEPQKANSGSACRAIRSMKAEPVSLRRFASSSIAASMPRRSTDWPWAAGPRIAPGYAPEQRASADFVGDFGIGEQHLRRARLRHDATRLDRDVGPVAHGVGGIPHRLVDGGADRDAARKVGKHDAVGARLAIDQPV